MSRKPENVTIGLCECGSRSATVERRMTQTSLLSARVPPPPQAGRYTVLYLDSPWPEHE